MVELHHEALRRVVKISDGFERLALTLLGTLSVAGVEQSDVSRAVGLEGDGSAHAGIHSTAEENHRTGVFLGVRH
jgi:hypothetical protein